MPYKDPEKRRAYHSAYNKNLSPKQKDQKRLKNAEWWSSDFGHYSAQKYHALERGCEFELTFNEWLSIWKESGHYDDRGPNGYVMCRKGDEGPYHIGNIYIAHNSQNKQDAWYNGKTCTPTGIYFK